MCCTSRAEMCKSPWSPFPVQCRWDPLWFNSRWLLIYFHLLSVAHFSFRPLIGCKQAGNDKHLDNSCNTSACGFIGCRCTREVTDKLPVFSTQLALLKLLLATLVFLHSATHSIQLIMRPLYNSIFPNRVFSIFKIIVSVTITCLESYINTELILTSRFNHLWRWQKKKRSSTALL